MTNQSLNSLIAIANELDLYYPSIRESYNQIIKRIKAEISAILEKDNRPEIEITHLSYISPNVSNKNNHLEQFNLLRMFVGRLVGSYGGKWGYENYQAVAMVPTDEGWEIVDE